jgi:hypothetical protein
MGDPGISTSIDFLNQLRQASNPNDNMSQLLMHILSVQITIAQKLDSNVQQTEETRQKVALHETKIAEQEAKIAAQEAKIATLEEKIEQITQSLEDYKICFNQELQNTNKAVSELTDKNSYLEQWRIDNAIFLSGFQQKMDSKLISQQVATIYKLSIKDIEYHYSFSISNAKETKMFHYVVIGFANRQSKTNLFTQKKNLGKLYLQQLVPSTEESRNSEIYISNRLTKTNLAIQKELLELKKESFIKRIIYKNCTLHAKITDDSALVPVKSFNDFENLLEKVPKKMDLEPQSSEVPGSSSKNASIQQRLEAFHYKKN